MTGGELTHANPWFGGPNGLLLICPWETEDLNNVIFLFWSFEFMPRNFPYLLDLDL